MRLEEMRKKVNNGEIVSINRTKSEIQRNRIQKGGFTSSSWYLKGKTYQVISCQPSPGGILARELTESLKNNPDRRILVTEDGGIPVSLKKADPFYIALL